ncbi:F-box/RNI superfamily protein [Medicago truncatula]|uniref:F-box/RNI superfamily protein n=1 Tax=Medicago truncatula TaxID=3880 RepID=G7KDW3_MEDTR|nr:F-box/RNI superfamily protein [Medicago truncatula]
MRDDGGGGEVRIECVTRNNEIVALLSISIITNQDLKKLSNPYYAFFSKALKCLLKPKAYEDRLSNLPDSVILHILSFLNTKEVVRTCVLSTRWKIHF